MTVDPVSRRSFLKVSGAGVGGALLVGGCEAWPREDAMARAEANTASFDLVRAERSARSGELPEARFFHRLPLPWYMEKVRRIKAQARMRGVDGGILLTNRWNIVYASGLLHSTTERPFACFFPMDQDDAVIWLHPYLDEELVRGWWCTAQYSYFDYHHADGGFPNREDVVQGPTRNIYRWWGETLGALGYGSRTLGIDSGGLSELGILPGQLSARHLDMSGEFEVPTPHRPQGGSWGEVASALPEARFVDVYDILMRQRIVKDEMETSLAQRAMNYFSEIHAFARNYLLERGTSAVDFEIGNAARLWGMHRIMKDIPQTGEPHDAVGIDVGISCRTGKATAYPHPNQTFWSPIRKGDALQIAGVVRVGGYGGELYRSFLMAPWTDWQERVWEVHQRSYYIQAEESYAGNTCSNVARAVHDYQVQEGCSHLVYHRPGHGEGMEGHQPPYHALGDYTVMKAGMHFSNEPGLYDPEHGFGFNFSDNILVAEGKGLQMGTTPATKEWCFLEL
jgi:Xaa-Pro dipeptidase